MRAPSPRSGLAVMPRPGCSAAGCAEVKSHSAANCDWRVPPERPPPSAEASPASSGAAGENTWSPNEPVV